MKIHAFMLSLLLGGCSAVKNLPSTQDAEQAAKPNVAAAWQTPSLQNLPHGGQVAALKDWWANAADPSLSNLMQAAQDLSPNLAAARSRIVQARAGVVDAQAAFLPQLNGQMSASRGVSFAGFPPASRASAGAQASWEADLWGSNNKTAQAAALRYQGAQLGWHEARVLVAYELAAHYFAFRQCENQLDLAKKDAASRSETARLAELSSKAGFLPAAQAQLAIASSKDASGVVLQSQTACELQIKALVALTGKNEPDLRQILKMNQAKSQEYLTEGALFSIANAVPSVPTQMLAQRPDIAAARDAVIAAALDAQIADARRLPSLSLNANFFLGHIWQQGKNFEGNTWSLGPVALNLPITQGPQIKAQTEARVAAYEEAVIALQAKARQAVREVEESLLQISSSIERQKEARAAASGYQISLEATQARYRAGLANLSELEDARRTALFAKQNQLNVERDRIAAWLALYRATGGGWTLNDKTPN